MNDVFSWFDAEPSSFDTVRIRILSGYSTAVNSGADGCFKEKPIRTIT